MASMPSSQASFLYMRRLRPVQSYMLMSQRRLAIMSFPGSASRGQVSEQSPQ